MSSPCLDAGDPAAAFNLEPAPNGGRVNMGYDGNTATASKTVPPTVTAFGPKGTAVGVSANIVVAFSQDMTRVSAQNAMTINGVKPTASSGAFSWVGRKMTFNPTFNLAPGANHTVVIGKSARSRAGVKMARPFTWTFTTKTPVTVVTVAAAPTALGAQVTLSLAAAADVTVSIRNLAGREVAVLTPGRLEAGVQSLLWNGKSKIGTRVPRGTYLLQVVARGANGTSTQAMASLPLR